MIAETITKKDLRPYDVLCYEKKGFVGRGIQGFSRSYVNHTSDVDTDLTVWEAIFNGYKNRTLEESIDSNTVYIIVKRPKFRVNPRIHKGAISKMKKAKYEFEGIWYSILRIFGSGWKGDKEVVQDVFCSKATAYILFCLGVTGYDKYYQMSPNDILLDFKNFDTYILKLD